MRSPFFVIISLVSTTLLTGSSAASNVTGTTAPAAASKQQVGGVLARSMEALLKVNATLRQIQASGATTADNRPDQNIGEHTKKFNELTQELKASTTTGQAPVQVQIAVQPTTQTAGQNIANNTATAEISSLASPQNMSAQVTPMSSGGSVTINKLALTTSPRATTTYMDEGYDEGVYEPNIYDALPNASGNKRSGDENNGIQVEISNKAARTSEISGKVVSSNVIDMTNYSSSVQNSTSSSSTGKSVVGQIVQNGPKIVAANNDKKINLNYPVSVATIKSRLIARMQNGKGNTASQSSNSAAVIIPKATLNSGNKEAVVNVPVKNAAVPQLNTQVAVTSSPVVSNSPIQNTSVTSSNNPADALIPLMGDISQFMFLCMEIEITSPECLIRPTSQNNQSLFEIACRAKNMEIAELLFGLKLFVPTFGEQNVLDFAVDENNFDLIKCLLTEEVFKKQVSALHLGKVKNIPSLLTKMLEIIQARRN